MKPISKLVLIATLALGASFSIVELKLARADAQSVTSDRRDFVARTGSSISIAMRSSELSNTEPVQNPFDPEPNAPPARTGGAGSR